MSGTTIDTIKNNMEPDVRINWKVNQVIRHRLTGHPYLILHVSKYFCTVIDLETDDPLTPTWTLLQRNFDDYALDHDMRVKKNEDWEYYHISI